MLDSTMREKPHIVRSALISETRIFGIEELELLFSNGTRACYERLKGPAHGSVMVVPLIDPNTVVLIREYAVGTQRYELGLPKGRIEAREDLLNAANREIMEEIGFGAKHLQPVGSLSIAPGYIASRTEVVLARSLYRRRLSGDEPERLEVVRWKLDELHKLLDRDDFSEARSIAALYIVRDLLDKERGI
jgi:ADP-ribose diphosphatase